MSFEIPDNLADLTTSLVLAGFQVILMAVFFFVNTMKGRAKKTVSLPMIEETPDPEAGFSHEAKDLLGILRRNNPESVSVSLDDNAVRVTLRDPQTFGVVDRLEFTNLGRYRPNGDNPWAIGCLTSAAGICDSSYFSGEEIKVIFGEALGLLEDAQGRARQQKYDTLSRLLACNR